MATWNWCRSWAAGYVQRTGGEQETDAGEIPGAERWSGDPKLPDVQTSHWWKKTVKPEKKHGSTIVQPCSTVTKHVPVLYLYSCYRPKWWWHIVTWLWSHWSHWSPSFSFHPMMCFKEEHPGFDFSGASFSGQAPSVWTSGQGWWICGMKLQVGCTFTILYIPLHTTIFGF